jgi:biotin synthase-related radical SAM superfamily protein
MPKTLQLSATIRDKIDIINHLTPKSPIYQGHSKLKAEVAMVRLEATDLDTINQMCRTLNTDITGLMDFVDYKPSKKGNTPCRPNNSELF